MAEPYKSFMTYQPGSAVFAKFVKGNSIEIRRVPDTDFVAKLRNEEWTLLHPAIISIDSDFIEEVRQFSLELYNGKLQGEFFKKNLFFGTGKN